MNEIVCPNCKKTFKVDEAGFADILKQVRDHQFEDELTNRLALAENEKDSAVRLAEANVKNTLQEVLCNQHFSSQIKSPRLPPQHNNKNELCYFNDNINISISYFKLKR